MRIDKVKSKLKNKLQVDLFQVIFPYKFLMVLWFPCMKTELHMKKQMFVQQCYGQNNIEGCNTVKIISDDTDVFTCIYIDMLFFPVERTDVNRVYMWRKVQHRYWETVRKHLEIMSYILQGHALSDGVCSMYGNGKPVAVKAMSNKNLSSWKYRCRHTRNIEGSN